MNRLELKAQLDVSDAGLITGVAWPFGSPDRIGDLIEKGAFAGAATPLPMLAFHDPAKPCGVWNKIEEKSDGLHVVGKLLVDDVLLAREMRSLVREGAVRGLSIGFSTKKATTRKGGGRTIQALELAEISLVTIPMHPAARVTGMKSAAAAIALADAIISVLKTGVAADFPASNPADKIIAMFHALPQPHAQNAVWLMNRTTLGTIRTWKDTTGRYLAVDPITAGAPVTLLGRPVVEAIDMDSVGANKFPILFGDLSGYRIVDRVSLSVLRDPYSLATKGQVRFHARKRVGADVTHPDRFVKLQCAV